MDREIYSFEEVRAHVRSAGHYKVLVEPNGYAADRFPTLTGAWQVISDSRVSLRGWDYPHVSNEADERSHGENYIQSWIAWARNQEYWRLYQSGQFVHAFAFRENRPEVGAKLREHLAPLLAGRPEPSGFLSITSTIWT